MNNGFQFINFMPSIFPVFQRDADGNKIKDNVVGGICMIMVWLKVMDVLTLQA